MIVAHAGAAELGSWSPLIMIGGVFVAVVIGLIVAGQPGDSHVGVVRLLHRIATGMERITAMPGWAACTVGLAILGLISAGAGFFSDVAWHVDLGRDEALFTAPHTMIVVGLVTIAGSSLVAVILATVTRVATAWQWRGLRIPYSAVPLGILGVASVSGFPLDELWHRRFGIDVTMWSPTHLLMILGASFTPLACWLVVGEARITRELGGWAKGLRVLLATLTLAGLASTQGEFSFGVPQFQQLYHPVLIAIAVGLGLVLTRLLLGPWRTFAVTALMLLLESGDTFRAEASGDGHAVTRGAAIYVTSAIAVEVAAWLLGTERRMRFALASAAGISTFGLAGEWLYNRGAHQPWTAALLPDALILGGVAAVGAAVLAVGLAAAVNGDGPAPRPIVIAGAGLMVLLALALPLPRRTGAVDARLDVDRSETRVRVAAELSPADAADDARWFQLIAWQGGGLVIANMKPEGDGRWIAEKPVPAGGRWKVLLRLHRGAEMMSIPISLPPDPTIRADALVAKGEFEASFDPEGQYMMREHDFELGPFAFAIYALLVAVAGLWTAAFVMTANRLRLRVVGRPYRAEHDQNQVGLPVH